MSSALLVVADDPAKLKRILETLERSGYRCAKVGSPTTATSLLRHGAVDLVLMDVATPCGDVASPPVGRRRVAAIGSLPAHTVTARPLSRVQYRPWGPVV